MESEIKLKSIISKVKDNVDIMMKNRGYYLSKVLEDNKMIYKSLNKEGENKGENKGNNKGNNKGYKQKILIILSIDEKKLDTNKINNIINYIKIYSEENKEKNSNREKSIKKEGMNKEDVNTKYIHTILIYSNVITPKTKEIINTYNSKELYMDSLEVFSDKMFMYDITKQKYFVRHEILPIDEKKILISKYKTNLSKILSTDAMCRYYGAVKGDILKIYRNDDTIFYRMCI